MEIFDNITNIVKDDLKNTHYSLMEKTKQNKKLDRGFQSSSWTYQNDTDLVACFAKNVVEETIRGITRYQPLRVVFRDSSFAKLARKKTLTHGICLIAFCQQCSGSDLEQYGFFEVINQMSDVLDFLRRQLRETVWKNWEVSMSILDYKLYENFRARVNQDNFVRFCYSNNNGKNNFNCICSAMDWIDIAVEYINNYKFNCDDSLNKKSIKFYTYISCIDIIYEAIKQLSKILEHKDIFDDDKSCFISKCTLFNDMTDNNYFKEIRAHFGAHPVNIGKGKHKYFASWPSKMSFTEEIYSISVYNSDINDSGYKFEVKIKELNSFLIKRYNLIKIFTDKLNKKYEDFCNKKRTTVIQKDENTHVYIESLINESKKRLNREDYKCTLQFIRDVMNYNNKNNKIPLDEYKEFLITVLDDIYNNLQKMNFEKEIYTPFSPPGPKLLDNAFGKLVESQRLGFLFPVQEEIKKYLENIINFDGVSNIKEVFILTLAGLYKKHFFKKFS